MTPFPDPAALCASVFVILALIVVALGLAWLAQALMTAPYGSEQEEQGFERESKK